MESVIEEEVPSLIEETTETVEEAPAPEAPKEHPKKEKKDEKTFEQISIFDLDDDDE